MNDGDAHRKLSELFKKFPGIGQRQAHRFAQFIAQTDSQYIQNLSYAISELNRVTKQCPECFIRHEKETALCDICLQENPEVLIVTEKDSDVHALTSSIETSSVVHFFVLGGLIPIISNTTSHLRVTQLIAILEKKHPKEVLIALSSHPDANHTTHYLATQLQKKFKNIRVTALGRGLASGSELEYSDPETLINAFKGRNNV